MRMILILVLVCLAPGVVPDADEDAAKKKFLEKVGKYLGASDDASLAALFPENGKVRLALRGVKSGRYRSTQAKSLLKTWFKAIEPKECELKGVERTYGRFSMKYKVKADATTVTKTLHVHLQKEGESWLIVGIVES